MKRLAFFLVTVVLAGVMLLAACAAPSPTFEPVVWTMAVISPAGHPTTETMREMGELVSERTGGKLSWEIRQWVEVGVTGPETLKIYGTGIVPIGEFGTTYVIGEEPAIATGALPFLDTIETIPNKLEALRPFVTEILDRRNIKPLLFYEYPNLLWCKFEVNTLDDVKKLKSWVASPTLINTLGKLGGTGLTLPVVEIYQALATGVINAVAISVPGGKAFGVPEVAKFLYLSPPLEGPPFVTAVNKDAFNALPADVQKVLVDTAKELEPILRDRIRYPSPEIRAEVEKFVTLYDNLDPQLVQQMIEQGAKPVWDEWVAEHPESKAQLDAILSATGAGR